LNAPDTASTDGQIYKFTGQYRPNMDMLFYATYSEGFRPGLLNRPGGASTALANGALTPCLTHLIPTRSRTMS
jgi:outer membrane receptor protein involved in Fe transport